MLHHFPIIIQYQDWLLKYVRQIFFFKEVSFANHKLEFFNRCIFCIHVFYHFTTLKFLYKFSKCFPCRHVLQYSTIHQACRNCKNGVNSISYRDSIDLKRLNCKRRDRLRLLYLPFLPLLKSMLICGLIEE